MMILLMWNIDIANPPSFGKVNGRRLCLLFDLEFTHDAPVRCKIFILVWSEFQARNHEIWRPLGMAHGLSLCECWNKDEIPGQSDTCWSARKWCESFNSWIKSESTIHDRLILVEHEPVLLISLQLNYKIPDELEHRSPAPSKIVLGSRNGLRRQAQY